jgi:hypothetical protein
MKDNMLSYSQQLESPNLHLQKIFYEYSKFTDLNKIQTGSRKKDFRARSKRARPHSGGPAQIQREERGVAAASNPPAGQGG